MKVTVRYQCDVEIEVCPEDLADALCGKKRLTDDMIERAIRENVGESASDREWPTFLIDSADLKAAIEAVKKELPRAREADVEDVEPEADA